jgi:hypothetical protein
VRLQHLLSAGHEYPARGRCRGLTWPGPQRPR